MNIVVRARIDQATKDEATVILDTIGLTVSDAFRLMMRRIVAEKRLPFDPLVPNATTLAAIDGANRGDLDTVDSVEELFATPRECAGAADGRTRRRDGTLRGCARHDGV